MLEIEGTNLTATKTAIVAGAGIGLFFVVIKRLLSYLQPNREDRPSDKIVNTLKSHCSDYVVLGFDCQWITGNNGHKLVGLLQLATVRGFCAVFRLRYMQPIPHSLRNLLKDESIIKVGVDCVQKAQQLTQTYGVKVASTLDLRYLAAMARYQLDDLEKLLLSVLNVELKPMHSFRSDCEEKRLIGEQIEFAANNALAAVEIFKNLIQKLQAKTSMRFTKADFSEMKPKIGHYFGLHFRKDLVTCLSRSYEAPFEGCFLEAPEDGETLCSVNEQKANWYLQEQLGVKIKSVPFTIRLNFKPPLGFYHIEKNECVVCGHSDAFVHKNLVPMEYRVHFPIVTQLHTSNDILTLCPKCDRLNSANDLIIQQELSEICDAPYSYEQLKKVKMTARQLIHNASEMSMERRKSLEALVLTYFKAQKNLTLHMLIEASELNLRVQDCYEHGKRVVQKFRSHYGGLKELEIFWRDHFLTRMLPKYLPQFWFWDIDWKYEPRIVEIY